VDPATNLQPQGRSRRLPALIGFNGVAQVAPMLVMLGLTPVLIDRLGSDRFGIWSLAVLAIGALTTLDGGVSASLARFFTVHSVRDDAHEAGRLLLGSLLLFAVLGVVGTAIAWVVVPLIVPHLHIPPPLRDETIAMLRLLPAVASIALAGDAAVALLQGNGRFREAAIATVVSVGVFAVAVLTLVDSGPHLQALLAATALRYAVLAVVALLLAGGGVRVSRPLLPARAVVREVGAYASRMQLASLSGLVNAELDGFVIAAVEPVRYVGYYGIGLQVASAARSLPLYAFSPLLTRLTATYGRGGRDAAKSEFDRLERRWLPGVAAYGVAAVAAAPFVVPLWLGREHHYVLSGIVAAVLLSGYMFHVGLTGMRTCYVRAVGRPGLEARYSTVWTVLNAALTVPFAIAAGMIGVVSVTAATGIAASGYFVWLCRGAEGLPSVTPPGRWWIAAPIAALVTVLGEAALLRTDAHGLVGLAASCLPPLLGLAVFVPSGVFRRHLS
jgi:O-antigen/teichoic acid export membrane protein